MFDTLFELQIEAHNRMRELRVYEVSHRGLNWLEQQHDVCTRDNCVLAFDFSGVLTKRIAQVRNICKKLAQVELLDDWERSSIGLPSLDCANWEIGRGLFCDRFFGTCSIKEKKLRKWEVYAL